MSSQMTRTVVALCCVLPAGLLLALLGTACAQSATRPAGQPVGPSEPPPGLAFATFAGGCFWCMEPPFDAVGGVVSTTSGYTGGSEENPRYDDVAMGKTGHAESVQILYDPAQVSYEALLEVYWRNIDPMTRDAQFCDHGKQYRTAIFFHDEEQRRQAESSRQAIDASGVLPRPIVTEITPISDFYPAEQYHQDFYMKNSGYYKNYRAGCGRDRVLREIWGETSH